MEIRRGRDGATTRGASLGGVSLVTTAQGRGTRESYAASVTDGTKPSGPQLSILIDSCSRAIIGWNVS
jgi:hypothetical protein